MDESRKTILFYITCPKHLKNISMLRPFLEHIDIRVATDVQILEDTTTTLVRSHEQLDHIAPDLIVMFMAYPLLRRLIFQQYALQKKIPCIGIEEVHQLSLNNGRINHYFTPLDALAVPNETERGLFRRVPVPFADQISVTGWGFFEVPEDRHNEKPRSAVLFLSPLSEVDIVSTETRSIREQLLLLTEQLQKKGYTITIKPHPMEPPHLLLDHLKALHLENMSIVRDGNVSDILMQHELVINRGNSQTCIEALHLGKKLLIVPAGQPTLFDNYCNVVSGTDNLDKTLDLLESETYKKEMEIVQRSLIPFSNDTALQNIAGFILKARYRQEYNTTKAVHMHLLSRICGQPREALACLDSLDSDNTLRQALESFMNSRINLAQSYKHAYKLLKGDPLAQSYLSKLYIDRILASGFLRYLRLIDPSWIRFPRDEFVPYFWGKSFAAYEHLYHHPPGYKLFTRALFKKLSPYKKRFMPDTTTSLPMNEDALKPYFVVAPLTYRCPLRCTMCSCPDQAKEIGELTPDQITACLNTITGGGKTSLSRINLTGGELFLRDDIPEIVERFIAYGVSSFGISSNGFMPKKTLEVFETLIETFPKISWTIQISLDGPTHVHNMIRGNNHAFEEAVRTLRELDRLKKYHSFASGINMTISPGNVHEVTEFAGMLQREYSIDDPITYTFIVDSNLFIDSRSSAIAEKQDSNYAQSLRQTALWLYRTEGDFFALDIYLMSLGFSRFTPCIFQSGGYFLEPSGRLYKCSIEKESFIASALTDVEFTSDSARQAIERIKNRCGSCSNNCGNSLVSRGIQDFFASDFFSSRKCVYLASPIWDIQTPRALKKFGIDYLPFRGQIPGKDELVLCVRQYHRCSDLLAQYPDCRVIPIKAGLID